MTNREAKTVQIQMRAEGYVVDRFFSHYYETYVVMVEGIRYYILTPHWRSEIALRSLK